MKATYRYALILLAFVSLLVACTPDPRNQADADKTRLLAAQEAADLTQARSQAADLHTAALREAEQTQAARVEAKNRLIFGGSVIALITLAILAAATIYVYSRRVAPGLAAAVVTAADLRARLIPLDRVTRQFPVLLQPLANGRHVLINPNVGQALLMTGNHEPTPQQITAASQAQVVGLIAARIKPTEPPGALLDAIHRYEVVTTRNPDVKLLTPKGKGGAK